VAWLNGGGSVDVEWALTLDLTLDGLGALDALLATGIGTVVFAYGTAYLPMHLNHERRPASDGRRFWPWMTFFMISMVVLEADESHADTQPGGEHRKRWVAAATLLRDDEDAGAEQCGDRVEIVAQDGRNLTEQHVAQDAAADAGDGAEQDRLHRPHPEVEGFRRARDAEEAQPDGVEDQHAALNAFQHRPAEVADDSGGGYGRQSRNVAAGFRSAGHG
jgi:hypothetical protein